jgi:hypothetical protein
VNPCLLWGLLLAGVPLLIQWLHRRTYTQRVWAAMRFLLAATEAQTRRLRIESLLLLCVRMLILLAVVLALAEPVLEANRWFAPASDAQHTLLLIDTSLSMQAAVDGVSAAERAKQAARHLAHGSRPGDSFQLVTIAARPEAVIRQPAFSRDAVLAEIDRLTATESLADVPAAVLQAERWLGEAPAGSRKRVAVISDFQQTSWQLETPTAIERTRSALTKLAGQATLSLMPVGAADMGNAAVVDARVTPRVAIRGAPTSLSVQVRNFGAEPRRQQRLQLLEDGHVVQTQTLDLPPYADVTAVFDTLWSEPGLRGLQLRLEDDALQPDNHRWLSVEVKDELSVLLVNGRESEQALAGATDFVELALRPPLTSGYERSALRPMAGALQPTVIREAALIRTDLEAHDCVFACDVPFLSDGEVVRLESFVRGGGGLVIGMGDQVQLDAYTRQLNRDGTGLMPVQLLRVTGDLDADAEPLHFTEPAVAHPITQPFAGNPQSGLTTANILRYVETRVPEDSTVRTALAYSNGAPAILEHDYGSGRVLLVTTSLDDRWANWALWPSFLPMMHQLVEYAVSGRAAERTTVGQSISLQWTHHAAIGQRVDVRRPDGRSSTLRLESTRQASHVTLEDTSQSGLYSLATGPPLSEERLLAVNIDPRESDLHFLRESDFQESIFGSMAFEVLDSRGSLPTVSAPPSAGSSLAGWLLAAALVLMLVEQVMAWNGRYGIIALAASPLLLLALRWLPAAGLLLLAVMLTMLLIVRRFRKRERTRVRSGVFR